ncbi:MAG: type II toxin-antitoxin system RelE/ParE family toxin [Eggerthellaceae bacterium]|nr:type II toxin-antitoxin system RelE/ParE family toxin [Eggerthellaceae bacterium]
MKDIVMCHVIRYTIAMIKTFANDETESVFADGKAKSLPPDVLKRARRKLFAIDAAKRIEDLRMPPGNRLHQLKGDRAGQHSLSVNDQWRICFSFNDGDAFGVELCDYR